MQVTIIHDGIESRTDAVRPEDVATRLAAKDRYAAEAALLLANRETWIIESCTETDECGEPLYWSNRDGWVHRDDAERFDREPVDVLLVGDYRVVRLDP